jgi:hypothetical protein
MFATGRQRFKKRSQAQNELEKINDSRNLALIIHYSCESFVENVTTSNRTTSIVVRYLESGQCFSFSIHQYAEILGIPITSFTFSTKSQRFSNLLTIF